MLTTQLAVPVTNSPLAHFQGILLGCAIAEQAQLGTDTAAVATQRLIQIGSAAIAMTLSQTAAQQWLAQYQPIWLESEPTEPSRGQPPRSSRWVDLVAIAGVWADRPPLQPALGSMLERHWGIEAPVAAAILALLPTPAAHSLGWQHPTSLTPTLGPSLAEAVATICDRSGLHFDWAIGLSQAAASPEQHPDLPVLTGAVVGGTLGPTAIAPRHLARFRHAQPQLWADLHQLAIDWAALYGGQRWQAEPRRQTSP